MTMNEDEGTSNERPDPAGTIARRTMLGALGIATVGGLTAGVLGLTGRAATPLRATAAASSSAGPSHDASHGAPAATGAPATPPMDHDAQAEAAVKAFPAKTAGVGLQEPPSTGGSGVR